jgi:hypothetical protein
MGGPWQSLEEEAEQMSGERWGGRRAESLLADWADWADLARHRQMLCININGVQGGQGTRSTVYSVDSISPHTISNCYMRLTATATAIYMPVTVPLMSFVSLKASDGVSSGTSRVPPVTVFSVATSNVHLVHAVWRVVLHCRPDCFYSSVPGGLLLSLTRHCGMQFSEIRVSAGALIARGIYPD